MVLEKVIHGYEITLDTDCDGAGDSSPDRVTGCWINKGDFSGSLELVRALDGLEDREGNYLPISNSTFFAIEKWALAHGY
jgi:hypothetical protein